MSPPCGRLRRGSFRPTRDRLPSPRVTATPDGGKICNVCHLQGSEGTCRDRCGFRSLAGQSPRKRRRRCQWLPIRRHFRNRRRYSTFRSGAVAPPRRPAGYRQAPAGAQNGRLPRSRESGLQLQAMQIHRSFHGTSRIRHAQPGRIRMANINSARSSGRLSIRCISAHPGNDRLHDTLEQLR